MDTIKIGKFLAELRKELGLTQEQLGEELGVTNKTISRWETGTYLPPVEMLQLLSERFDVSINDILQGERIKQEEYRIKSEENIKNALSCSAFTLQERIDFFKRKWKKEHMYEYFLCILMLAAVLMCGYIFDMHELIYIYFVGVSAFVIIRHNRMMAYIERRAFGQDD